MSGPGEKNSCPAGDCSMPAAGPAAAPPEYPKKTIWQNVKGAAFVAISLALVFCLRIVLAPSYRSGPISDSLSSRYGIPLTEGTGIVVMAAFVVGLAFVILLLARTQCRDKARFSVLSVISGIILFILLYSFTLLIV